MATGMCKRWCNPSVEKHPSFSVSPPFTGSILFPQVVIINLHIYLISFTFFFSPFSVGSFVPSLCSSSSSSLWDLKVLWSWVLLVYFHHSTVHHRERGMDGHFWKLVSLFSRNFHQRAIKRITFCIILNKTSTSISDVCRPIALIYETTYFLALRVRSFLPSH